MVSLILAAALAFGPRPPVAVAHAPRAVPDTTAPAANGDVLGLVTDSASAGPLAGVEVTVWRGADIVAATTTDQVGNYRVHDLSPGDYDVEAQLIGFHPSRRHVTIDGSGGNVVVNFKLTAASIELGAISVGAAQPVRLDTRTGDQQFRQDEFQGSPTLATSQIVQQAIAGAARAPTGEVHIRGQHAEYSYYVDGIPVPPGISGSLNELFDPSIVNGIDFQTGSWDAEYGGRNAAIVNVTTRIPAGGFHATVSGYGGNYAANGQTITASGHSGQFGLFFAGTRTATDMRREPVVADTDASGNITGVENFANHGEDLYGFGKIQYTPTDHDVLNLDLNWSRTNTQTPFDSSAGVINDNERDLNGFVNLGYTHSVNAGPRQGSQLFAAGFYRHGTLNYVPGANDDPTFSFAGDTTLYSIKEARSFNVIGAKVDYLYVVQEHLSFKFGTLVSATSGNEDFSSFNASGSGPASLSGLSGHDIGLYAQTKYLPTERVELRFGVRGDWHTYPDSAGGATTASQISPRIRLSFFPSPATTLWVYYGRQFMPTNTEDLRNITSASQGGAILGATTNPERDDFYEVGLTHRFHGGVVAKLSGYHKKSSPGVDDTQVPGTAITTDVNIEQVRITGIEGVLEVDPHGPFSGYLNLALNHAYGYGAVTGGYFAVTPPAQPFDLDHDQRLSSVIGVSYGAHNMLVTATGIYGSGLTNGVTPNTPGRPLYDSTIAATGPLNTGLFDFNKEFKVAPNFILNASASYTFIVGQTEVRPAVYVDNLFNHLYALKGAFFSGATFGMPRTVQVRVTVGI